MRVSPVAILTVAMTLAAAAAASAGPKHVPAQIAQARYVCLGYDTGERFLSEREAISMPQDVYPEDRRALDAIRDGLQKWGRYVITVRPDQAELLIAVRAGRRAGATVGVGVGRGGGRGGLGALGGIGGGQVSSADDMLTIYESNAGRVGAQLWRVKGSGALSGSPPRALEEFRADVDRTPTPRKP